MSRLLISGASGGLGRRTAEILLERRSPDELILVTRTPAAVADLAARGCEVRAGDYDDPAGLAQAYAGAARMLLISGTDVEARTDQHRAAIAAAAAAGVGHVVYTSGSRPEPPNPAVIAPSHLATERALADGDVAWTVLRDSLYSEYQVPEAAAAAASGVLTHNRGAGRVAYVSREDCAAVCAAVLASDDHAGAVYDVTGPEAFDAGDLARLYAELSGREIVAREVGDDELAEGLAGAMGGDDHARYGAALVTSFGRAIREGFLDVGTDVVERLTGRAPRRLRDVLAADRSWADPA